MLRTTLRAVAGALALATLLCLTWGVGVAPAATGGVVQLTGRTVSVTASTLSPSPTSSGSTLDLNVTLANTGATPVAVAPSDFNLSAGGDMFGARGGSSGHAQSTLRPHGSQALHVSFDVPNGAMQHAALVYRPAGGGASGVVPINGSAAAPSATPAQPTAQQPTINTFPVSNGVGFPWATAIDGSGNVWFTEPGCDFNPTCPTSTPAGQIGEFTPATGAMSLYTLPNIPGNQPIFLTFDGSNNLWFTTPNNSMIGEFNPITHTFGQWAVTAGTGPWDLTFASGQIWYTEHLGSAIGSFDPSAHTHQDFPTPSANANPYGIASNGTSVWFTENNSGVDRIGLLNTANNAISEYLIQASPTNSTPHLISLDPNGHPWWSEGWSGTIATVNPAAATPGSCGASSGPCRGIQRFWLPASKACSGSTHVSGIAFQSSTGLVWLDNSLTAQVGSFNPATRAFALNTLSNCNAHPHDGLNLDGSGDVWYDEEFTNALGELIPPVTTNPVSITVRPSPPVAGSPITFTATVSGSSSIASVQWSFGDGASAMGNPASHTYTASGSVTVTAAIILNNGAKAQTAVRIAVAPASPGHVVTPPPPPGGTPAPVNIAAPGILGSAREGRTLVARTGSWVNSPAGYSYQWQRCSSRCANIRGALNHSYTLTAADIGAGVRLVVNAGNSGGTGQAASRVLGPVAPSAARVRAAVARMLATMRRGLRQSTLLGRRHHTLKFTAPSAGTLAISWYAPYAGVHRTTHQAHRRPQLIATVRVHFRAGGPAAITIRLTRAGKAWLRRGTAARLNATATFTAVGGTGFTGRASLKLSGK